MAEARPVALISGANRGIGREVAHRLAQRGFRAILGCRDPAAGEAAAAELAAAGLDARAGLLDVTDPASVAALAARVERLDVLVNNAAIDYDTDAAALTVDLDRVHRALGTNLFGAWRMAQAFAPHLRASPHGRLVNVSSGAGAIGEMGGGLPSYHTSKLALNGLTRMLAAELRGDGVLVNSVCPGWVATDMGGRGGRPVADGAASVVWAVELDDDGPSGGFFRDGQPLPW